MDQEKHNDASIAIVLTRKLDTKLRKEIKNIKYTQRYDTKINQVINKIESGVPRREFTIRDGILYKGKTGKERIVLSCETMLKLIKKHMNYTDILGDLNVLKLSQKIFFTLN